MQRPATGHDLTDPALYGSGRWRQVFRELRAERPVSWHPHGDGDGFWAATRHRDIVAVSNDPYTYSSAKGGVFLFEQAEGLDGALLTTDPPNHKRLRRAVSKFFDSAAMQNVEAWLRGECRRLIDKAGTSKEVEFVYDVAADLPLNMIGELLEIDADKRRELLGLTDELIASGNTRQRQIDAAEALGRFGLGLAEARRAARGADLISAMLNAGTDDQLSDREFSGMFAQLAGAATETTRSVLTQIMIALAREPDLLAGLREGSVDLRLAIEEWLRWSPPVFYMRRTATCDTTLGGVEIAAGDKVLMYYASANFDEDMFEDPDRFDPGRRPNRHLSFGVGEHMCIGLQLARLELRIFLEEVIERVSAVRLTREPDVTITAESLLLKKAPMEFTLR